MLRHWRPDASHRVIGRIAIVGVDHDHFLGLFCANSRFVTKTDRVPRSEEAVRFKTTQSSGESTDR